MIKPFRIGYLGVALTLFACSAHAASFDCTKAATPSEILICGVPELSSADERLAELYRRARAGAADSATLRDAARAQLRHRDATCRDVDCLKGWYDRQIAHYQSLLGESPASVRPAAPLAVPIPAAVATPARTPSPPAAPVSSSWQEDLINIVAGTQKRSQDAENDMQRGGLKARRDAQICQRMSALRVSGWTGRVKTVSANSDGKGVLAIEVAPDIVVRTWNNEVSDMFHDTLIEPLSPVFDAAAMLKKGQQVTFSGTFFRGDSGDCLYESSLTLAGKLRSPEFIFRFEQIAPR